MIIKKVFWFISISIVIIGMFSVRDFNSRYNRVINGDGKAYYAYLPALFIYQDPSFSFIDDVEAKYYPEDRSQFKDFLNKQKNGRSVNKTFPGLSILYAPFFFLSMLVAWVGGFELDGYSLPFQMGIAISHLVYFFIGLRFLLAFFQGFKIRDTVSFAVFTLILFGTNCWYYLIYDHSVSHIHNFFLSCVLLWTFQGWIKTNKTAYLGWSGVVLCLLVITRPTNAVMVLFLPLIAELSNVHLKTLFSKMYWYLKTLIPYVVLGILILFIPFLLWKWQSDLWIVYSYNEEGFDFKNPKIFNFLFSYEKGWLLWSPILLVGILVSIYHFSRRSMHSLLWFIIPLLLIIYILSSWWCWTYGAGFGQRPMIEFLPFISLGIALFLQQFKKIKWTYFFIIPFSIVSLLQGFQIANSILIGGETTKDQYWSHFLQLKIDAPHVQLSVGDKWIFNEKRNLDYFVSKAHPYSYGVKLKSMKDVKKLVVKTEIGGKHHDPNIRIVVSNQDGSFYKAFFIGTYLYEEPRVMEFQMDVQNAEPQIYSCYIWNGDSDSRAFVRSIELTAYTINN